MSVYKDSPDLLGFHNCLFHIQVKNKHSGNFFMFSLIHTLHAILFCHWTKCLSKVGSFTQKQWSHCVFVLSCLFICCFVLLVALSIIKLLNANFYSIFSCQFLHYFIYVYFLIYKHINIFIYHIVVFYNVTLLIIQV